jgi:hypothetical protein
MERQAVAERVAEEVRQERKCRERATSLLSAFGGILHQTTEEATHSALGRMPASRADMGQVSGRTPAKWPTFRELRPRVG